MEKRVIAILTLLLFVGGLNTSYVSNAAPTKKHRISLERLAGGILIRFNQNEVYGPQFDDEAEEILQARESAYRAAFESERGVKLRHVMTTPRGEVSLLDVATQDVEWQLELLKADPRVDTACPNWDVECGPNPEPTGGSVHSQSVGGNATGKDGVVVMGSLDSGVRQADFQGSLYSVGFTVLDGVVTNTPEEDPSQRHGSAVAGIMTLNVQNGATLGGKDYKALIFPIRCVKPNGQGSAADLDTSARMFVDIAETDSRVRVLNLSLGDAGYDPFLEETLGEFFSIGGVVSAGAGNGGSAGVGRNLTSTPLYPGGYFQRLPMAVVAAANQGHVVLSSDYYDGTTTWAQGVGVDTGIGMSLSGTSAASPVVASGLGLRLLMGDSAAAALQAVAYSADQDSELAGKVIDGGGLYSLSNLIKTTFWVNRVRPPVTLDLNKVKAGKFTGFISDPALKIYVLGYPDMVIEVGLDGFFVKKQPGFTHTPVRVGCPAGYAVSSAKVKGL
jgi:hypothetical protein